MLTGSARPRQPRPSAPMCAGAGSAAADGEILIQSKRFCTCFDQMDPRVSGQRACLPSCLRRRVLNYIWEMNRKSRNAPHPPFVYKSSFSTPFVRPSAPAFPVSAQSCEPRAPLEKHDRISSCKQVLTLRRAYFWLWRGGGGGGEKKPQILLPTLLRSRSQLCSRFEGLWLQNMWPPSSNHSVCGCVISVQTCLCFITQIWNLIYIYR